VGKHDTAVDLITKALAFKPDYAEAHCNLGLAIQGLGQLDEAVASYQKALAIKPDSAKVHSNLGAAFHDLEKLDEAFTCHRRAIALNPDNDSFWAGLAAVLAIYSFTSVDDDFQRGPQAGRKYEAPTFHSPPPLRGARR